MICRSSSDVGLVRKMVNTWPKKFYAILFQKLVFLVSLYPEILERKKQRNKKSWFLVNSCCFRFAFHANLMSGRKKKRLKFLFITQLILLINMSISLFQLTVQLIKTQQFFVTKRTKLCSIILMSKMIEFYRYTENEKSNT